MVFFVLKQEQKRLHHPFPWSWRPLTGAKGKEWEPLTQPEKTARARTHAPTRAPALSPPPALSLLPLSFYPLSHPSAAFLQQFAKTGFSRVGAYVCL